MARDTPTLTLLEAFDMTARHGSITKAAAALFLTQSAVSRQIALLEQQLGAALFDRVRNRLLLTQTGADYLRSISRPLAELRAASLDVRRGLKAREQLRIAVLPTFGARWLIPRLKHFSQQHPQIDIRLTSTLGWCDLAQLGLDGAIHFGMPDWPRTKSIELASEDLMVVGRPEPGQGDQLDPEALSRRPLIEVSSRSQAWPRWFHDHGLPGSPQFALSVDTFSASADAAEAGFGIALLPSFAVQDAVAARRLVCWHASRPQTLEKYYFVYPDDRPLAGAFGSFVGWLDQGLVEPGGKSQPMDAAVI